ncbi:MAG: hypothetical protein Q9199_007413 [Rusavskia elegans]
MEPQTKKRKVTKTENPDRPESKPDPSTDKNPIPTNQETDDFSKDLFGTIYEKKPVLDLQLPDHDPAAFKLLQTFLYTEKFPELTRPAPLKEGQQGYLATHVADEANFDRLLNLYIMADDWEILDLKNTCMDHIRKYSRDHNVNLRLQHVTAIYKRTKQADEPLRRYAVDQFVFNISKKTVTSLDRQHLLQKRTGVGAGRFLCDVVDVTIKMKKYIDPNAKGKLAYVEMLEPTD